MIKILFVNLFSFFAELLKTLAMQKGWHGHIFLVVFQKCEKKAVSERQCLDINCIRLRNSQKLEYLKQNQQNSYVFHIFFLK